METSGLLVEQATLKDVWRFVSMLLGALCVISIGEQLMQMWHVDNLDLVDQVNTLNLTIYSDCWWELVWCKKCNALIFLMPLVKVTMSTFSQAYANKLVTYMCITTHFCIFWKTYHILPFLSLTFVLQTNIVRHQVVLVQYAEISIK